MCRSCTSLHFNGNNDVRVQVRYVNNLESDEEVELSIYCKEDSSSSSSSNHDGNSVILSGGSGVEESFEVQINCGAGENEVYKRK